MLLQSEAIVAGSAQTVWATLVDFTGQPLWASGGRLEGTARVGERVTYAVGSQHFGGEARPLRVEGALKRLEAERRLEWAGGIAGLTLLTLTFDLCAVSGGTRVTQQLRITGLAPRLFKRRFERTFLPALEAFTGDLQRRFAEAAKCPPVHAPRQPTRRRKGGLRA